MFSAVVGAVIVVTATTALVLALEVAESSIDAAGRQPLNAHEQLLLQQARRGDEESLRRLEADLQGFPRQ